MIAHRKLILAAYGDWENRPGITFNAGASVNRCKETSALVLLAQGQRKDLAAGPLTKVSLYHALVFYPLAVLVGSGGGGRWGDDPIQSNVMIWSVPAANGSLSETTSQRRIEVLHNAIDQTITIGGKTYQLTAGNMFVIRVGADWQPTVTQLDEVFEQPATARTTLDRFKALFKNDASIQKLELY